MNKITCYAFDFDGTIAYQQNGLAGFFKIFINRGIPQNIIEEAYQQSKKYGGFCLSGLITSLKNKKVVIKKEPAIKDEFDRWLKQSLKLYPDAHFLPSPTVIVTYGNPKFQKQKIEISNIQYDKLYASANPQGKVKALIKLIQTYGTPIAFTDNRLSELDKIRDTNISEKEIITHHILRSNNRYSNEKGKYKHRQIRRLNFQ